MYRYNKINTNIICFRNSVIGENNEEIKFLIVIDVIYYIYIFFFFP